MNKHIVLGALLALVFSGCVTPGPFLRVATASAAELTAAKDKPEVWYEFQPGDQVPFQLMFIGVVEGAPEQPVPVRAKRKFYIVSRKNLPLAFSFDGRSLGMSRSMQALIGVLPKDNGEAGGVVGWVTYVGESGRPEEELKEQKNP